MKIVLILTFCLIGKPTECQKVTPVLEEGWSDIGICMGGWQLPVRHWLDEHPGWEFVRAECTPGGKPKEERS